MTTRFALPRFLGRGRNGTWSFCLLIAGCGMSELVFLERYTEASCAALMACAEHTAAAPGFSSQADCEAFTQGFINGAVAECDYHAGPAADCLADLAEADCAAILGPVPVGACRDAYTGPCQFAGGQTPP